MKKLNWKTLFMLGLFGLLTAGSASHAAMAQFSFDNIDHWAGSGSNEAAFVVDFNDGNAAGSMVWGFRWDGSATAEDMLLSVVASDANLYGKKNDLFGNTNLLGLGYDMDGDGFGLSDGTVFGSNGFYTDSNGNVGTETVADSDDRYASGQGSSGWVFLAGSEARLTVDGTDWTTALMATLSGTGLSDGDAFGLAFIPDFMTFFGNPVYAHNGQYTAAAGASPVPVPGAVFLLGSGLLGLAGMSRKK